MAQKQAQTTAAEAAAPPKKKRGKLLLIVSLVLVLAGGGGGAAWFFMKPADSGAGAVAKPKPALFMPLEVFTANLAADEGQPQFIQVGLTLKTTEQETIDLVKERMPEVRNRILMVLSGKRGADLLPIAGKEKLATEIGTAVKGIIAPLVAAKAAPAGKADEAEEKPAAEDTDGGEAKPGAAKPADKGPAIEVLFTAFMIQ
jgi:flagellar FliL protein